MIHRRKYRVVLNKFMWWFKGSPAVQFDDESYCSVELWQLALKDYNNLNRRQKNQVLRHFWSSQRRLSGS